MDGAVTAAYFVAIMWWQGLPLFWWMLAPAAVVAVVPGRWLMPAFWLSVGFFAVLVAYVTFFGSALCEVSGCPMSFLAVASWVAGAALCLLVLAVRTIVGSMRRKSS